MKKEINAFFNLAKYKLSNWSPHIFLGIGVIGFGTTIVMACKATPKAIDLKNNAEIDKGCKLNLFEEVKAVTPAYWPSAVTGALSVGCFVLSTSISERKKAAALAAYSISEAALKTYQDKVIDTIGKKKEGDLRASIAQDKVNSTRPEAQYIISDHGLTMCFDSVSGRYFKSDIEKIRKAVNNINERMIDEMTCTLNDFYDELDIPPIAIGWLLGWDINRKILSVDYDSTLTKDNVPCLVLDYKVYPQEEWKSWY